MTAFSAVVAAAPAAAPRKAQPSGLIVAMGSGLPRLATRTPGTQAGRVDDDGALEQAITRLLDARVPSSICPSDAARAVDPESWRRLMPAARAAAGRLAAAGEVEVTQRGEVVDVGTARGPVRIRRPR